MILLKTYVSINKEIVKALSPIIPISHLNYTGTSKDYATFEVSSRQKALEASGDNFGIDCYGYIDVFTASDPSREQDSLIEKIDSALEERDISVVTIRGTEYVQSMNCYHTEITFRKVVQRKDVI